ncbi:class I SAM-dependent methyltransferase [Candidatus Bipolaricaulota bacterium]
MTDQKEPASMQLDSTQQVILDALIARGIEGRSILEIGCGTGGLHHQLLAEGAASAIGVELSADYLAKAKARSRDLGHEDRATYHKGDFVELADQIEPADITILDKVVHCYHDPRLLIRESTAHTRNLYAVSFLKNRWILRVAMRLLGPFMRFFFPFRIRFSHPEKIRFWIQEEGFELGFQAEGETFHTEIYTRMDNTADSK